MRIIIPDKLQGGETHQKQVHPGQAVGNATIRREISAVRPCLLDSVWVFFVLENWHSSLLVILYLHSCLIL